MICYPDESEDQKRLLDTLLTTPCFLSAPLAKQCAYSAALACQDQSVMDLLSESVGKLLLKERQLITYAVSRMSTTNPYFMSRKALTLLGGGTLSALNLRPLSDLDISDTSAYHYACVCVSVVNGGYECLQSHADSLRQGGQNDDAIDEAIRITVAVMAARQIVFLENRWPVYSS